MKLDLDQYLVRLSDSSIDDFTYRDAFNGLQFFGSIGSGKSSGSGTNNCAAETIGKAFKKMTSISTGKSESVSLNEHLRYQVELREFTTLPKGGPKYDFLVEGVITIKGQEWSDGKNYRRVRFKQN